MKLETVSKIKGWVAVAAWTIAIPVATVPAPRHIHVWEILLLGSSPFVALIYTVKWFRLRRRIREWEYQARVRALG